MFPACRSLQGAARYRRRSGQAIANNIRECYPSPRSTLLPVRMGLDSSRSHTFQPIHGVTKRILAENNWQWPEPSARYESLKAAGYLANHCRVLYQLAPSMVRGGASLLFPTQ